ncbi:MAG: hypothetical protein A4E63_02318 [Syntrophorhabdus sp. PtaU1.Bin050]|nr:MAG: hypothetical protein A4E63_02318 [Syntrophorhabdus sp. PtaU1.Bin050]
MGWLDFSFDILQTQELFSISFDDLNSNATITKVCKNVNLTFLHEEGLTYVSEESKPHCCKFQNRTPFKDTVFTF